MKTGRAQIVALGLLWSLGTGCTNSSPDFCSLLSVAEVQEFDSDVLASRMGERGRVTPTKYCIYSNRKKEEVFLLSIGNATKNSPYDLLQTYTAYMDGENKVEKVAGIGNSAAALFSDDYDADKFRILFANNDKWSITVRALGVSDKNSRRFLVLKELANKALSRF